MLNENIYIINTNSITKAVKRTVLWLLLIVFTNTTLKAQVPPPPPPKKVDIEAVIVAYITKKMNLTAAEAQEFWPVFNNYKKEFKATATETDEIKKSEAIVALQKKYKPQFQQILKSESRANNIFKVHRDLMQRLKQLIENRKNRVQQRKGSAV